VVERVERPGAHGDEGLAEENELDDLHRSGRAAVRGELPVAGEIFRPSLGSAASQVSIRQELPSNRACAPLSREHIGCASLRSRSTALHERETYLPMVHNTQPRRVIAARRPASPLDDLDQGAHE
jgi:hypothetical protein